MKTSTQNIFKAQGTLILMVLLSMQINFSKAASTWVGGVSASWSNALNWNPQAVPGPLDDVVIPFLAVDFKYPVMDAPGIEIKSLSLADLAKLWGQPGASIVIDGNTIDGGRITTNGANMTFKGNLTGTGTIDGGNSFMYIAGDMTLTGFVDSVSTVVLNGSTLQHLRAYTFYNLIIANTGSGIILIGGPTVINTLNMTSGNIALNNQQLTLGNDAKLPGTLLYNGGYITGSLGSFRRWFNTNNITLGSVDGLFPMGTTTSNRSLWVSTQPTQGGWIALTYVDSTGRAVFNPPYTESGTSGSMLVNVRYGAKWVVTSDSIFASSIAMRIQGSGIPGINDYTKLTMSLANNAAPGAFASPTGSIVNPQANRVLLNSGDINNAFYIASDSSINPLPVSLIAFTAVYGDGGVNLNWRTASEINNNHFEIERSMNGSAWEAIGSVSGHDNSQVENTYTYFDGLTGIVPAGAIYYRLKQVDNNSEYEYSRISVATITNVPVAIAMYPNPTNDIVNITWTSNSSENTDLRVIDITGRELYKENITGQGLMNKQLDLSSYKNGAYMVQLVTNEKSTSKVIYKR
jgi:hypothetical protein